MDKYQMAMEYRYKSREEIMELYRTADINEVDHYQEGLLHIAATFADSEAIEYLLSKGMDPNGGNSLEQRPLDLLAKENRDYDIKEGERKKCALLLLDAKASTMRKDVDGKTAVLRAAELGRSEILEAMLEKDAKMTMSDREGNTALHVVCDSISMAYDPEGEEAYLKSAKILLEAGLDPEAKNNYDQTPIDFAIESGNKKLAAILKGLSDDEGGDSHEARTGGMDIFQAIEKADYEALKANLELGTDVNSLCEERGRFEGMSPLGIACYILDLESVQILLEKGADPNLTNSEGETAVSRWFRHLGDFYFHFEKLEGNIPQQIFKLLIEKGLNVNAVIDQDGNTALTKAAIFLERGSSYNGKTLCGILMKLLLKENPDINYSNLKGQTALMALCGSNGNEANDLLIQVLEMDADVGAADANGDTSLIYAARNAEKIYGKEAAELLFDFGDPNYEHINNEGKSALEIATENDNEELVKYLLMRG